MSHTFRLALAQMKMSHTPSRNETRARELAEKAAAHNVDLLILPELYRTPYFCQSQDESFFDLAEPLDGASAAIFSAVAKKKRMAIVVPVFERRASGLYHNTALLFDKKGERVGFYRKTHIPHDPSFEEKYYFTPGEERAKIFDLGFVKIAPLICWDQWFPENARLAALQGAELIVYPTAIGALPNEAGAEAERIRDAWVTVQRGHAIANALYVAAVNRVGVEKSANGSITFFGSSFVAAPSGELLAEASHGDEELLITDIDRNRIEETRRVWPFFRDRRIDLYGGLTERIMDDTE